MAEAQQKAEAANAKQTQQEADIQAAQQALALAEAQQKAEAAAFLQQQAEQDASIQQAQALAEAQQKAEAAAAKQAEQQTEQDASKLLAQALAEAQQKAEAAAAKQAEQQTEQDASIQAQQALALQESQKQAEAAAAAALEQADSQVGPHNDSQESELFEAGGNILDGSQDVSPLSYCFIFVWGGCQHFVNVSKLNHLRPINCLISSPSLYTINEVLDESIDW